MKPREVVNLSKVIELCEREQSGAGIHMIRLQRASSPPSVYIVRCCFPWGLVLCVRQVCFPGQTVSFEGKGDALL